MKTTIALVWFAGALLLAAAREVVSPKARAAAVADAEAVDLRKHYPTR